MKYEYDILTALDVCIDFLAAGVPEPRFGQTEQLIDDYALELGGSAVIFASQCAKLGLKTLGVGSVGQDYFGRIFRDRLAETGVDVSGLVTDNTVKTGVGIILSRGIDRAILTYPGTIDRVDPNMVEQKLGRARHLHIASYYLTTRLRPHWGRLVRQAKELGMTVSLDTNWDPDERWDGLDDLKGYVDVLLPNEQEAAAFTGQKDYHSALEHLSRDFPVVVIKLGKHGAIACRDDLIEQEPAWPGEPVDTTGAGDSFDAGFIYGWLNKFPLSACLKYGCYCGGRNVTATGGTTAQPFLAEIDKALQTRGAQGDGSSVPYEER